MKYFHIRGKHTPNAAVAHVPSDFDEFEFWDDLESRSSRDGWGVINANARPFKGAKNPILLDWSPSDLLPRLCSKKLMQIIAPFSNKLVWLPVTMNIDDGAEDYFIMHFTDFPDVLEPDKTEYVAGRLFRPHLDLSKTNGMSVFAISPLTVDAIIADDVRVAIVESRCTGMEFETVGAS